MPTSQLTGPAHSGPEACWSPPGPFAPCPPGTKKRHF